jgi:hypothetical protein
MGRNPLACDEVPPRGKELDKHSAQMPDGKEAAASVSAAIVMNGNFHDPEAAVLKPSHHLHTDHAAIACEPDISEQSPAEETEIAVNVLDM